MGLWNCLECKGCKKIEGYFVCQLSGGNIIKPVPDEPIKTIDPLPWCPLKNMLFR